MLTLRPGLRISWVHKRSWGHLPSPLGARAWTARMQNVRRSCSTLKRGGGTKLLQRAPPPTPLPGRLSAPSLLLLWPLTAYPPRLQLSSPCPPFRCFSLSTASVRPSRRRRLRSSLLPLGVLVASPPCPLSLLLSLPLRAGTSRWSCGAARHPERRGLSGSPFPPRGEGRRETYLPLTAHASLGKNDKSSALHPFSLAQAMENVPMLPASLPLPPFGLTPPGARARARACVCFAYAGSRCTCVSVHVRVWAVRDMLLRAGCSQPARAEEACELGRGVREACVAKQEGWWQQQRLMRWVCSTARRVICLCQAKCPLGARKGGGREKKGTLQKEGIKK